MTVTLPSRRGETAATGAPGPGDRFRLHRAGILNVWQYDDQEFLLADGRMLLRGANGAGKSKTLEMLLPFALDGDKARITASARHHTSLLWLMTDGYEGQARVGYVWVEFLRAVPGAQPEAFTCGVGIRASASARTATAWHFATRQRVGHDLLLEDEGGPLSRPRLVEAIGPAGQVFEKAAAYKEHIGRTLFGLEVGQYDEVLRLLYWLRQPQVGEDIEPARLAGQLAQALPQLDEQAIKTAGDTFDELAAFGQQIERRTSAADALGHLAAAYARYARSTVAGRGRDVLETVKEERRLRKTLRRRESELAELAGRRATAEVDLEAARRGAEADQGRIQEVMASPEADNQRRLAELGDLADQRAQLARSAEERARRSEQTHGQRAEAQQRATELVLRRIGDHAQRLRDLDARQRELTVDHLSATFAALDTPVLTDGEQASAVVATLESSRATLTEAGASVRRRQAEVQVLHEALDRLEAERRRVKAAETEATRAEQRWERARNHRAEADTEVEAQEVALSRCLHEWAAEEQVRALTPPLALPEDLTADMLDALPALGRAAVDPELRGLRTRAQTVATTRDNAEQAIASLTEMRVAIEAERDPAPPVPALPRTPRPDGAALWRLVDFVDDVDEASRALIEAAMQASGLLDAWVRPDGAVLSFDARDVALPVGPALDEPTLADVLRPDPAPGPGVDAAVVTAVLRRVRLPDSVTDSGDAAIGRDGTWSLGPLHGRAAKETAQYVGLTARAQERERRLGEVDHQIAAARLTLDEAAAEIEALTVRIDGLVGWLRRLPSTDALRAAWTKVGERRAVERSEESANEIAQADAHRARQAAAQVRAEVDQLAVRHDLPADAGQLAALEERLRHLARDLEATGSAVGSLVVELDRWTSDHRQLADAAGQAAADREDARQLTADAASTTAALEELRASVGASVLELEERLRVLRESLAAHRSEAQRLEKEHAELAEQVGATRTALRTAEEELITHGDRRAAVVERLAALAHVPGLVDSAFETDHTQDRATEGGASHDVIAVPDRGLLVGAQSARRDEPLPAAVVDVAETLAGRAAPDELVDVSVVWKAYTDAVSGSAADHEPTVSEFADLITVTGRDEAGEQPVGRLAARVATAVARDRELLTERERERFERHVLGELGEAIRRCRLEADELVEAMNRLLSGVTTSQGIRVKLDWRLRDDVPTEARDAVGLFGQPIGALLPEERATLRDALHRLIEASRAEQPELAYGEHLAAALDYRSWFTFRIRYTRPESDGAWLDLHRRSPLSQGEQKVLCYLPLFAAAAAHFTSLAGAAPHAPRLVLLDDAFPKIDVRTHPLLFGLLVQLDLDFVITSERLWGDHDTVPSLAIYEALRDPTQRGIAQYEYRWDGRQLRSLG
jgi:uncharacterized protein (TIGR02680 family)